MQNDPDATITDQGHDWRAVGGASKNSDCSADLPRSREPGRGREANTPEQISAPWVERYRLEGVLVNLRRLDLSTSGGVAFFALLAVFPGIAAIVSMYGLFRRRK